MTLEEAIKSIVKDWDALREKQKGVIGCYGIPKIEAVWCAKSDTAGSYEVNEEWIGITEGGRIAWAYASGCSCWDGNYDENRFASLKEVVLTHADQAPEKWEKAIIKFAENGLLVDMQKAV
jgi:hypothetical protein